MTTNKREEPTLHPSWGGKFRPVEPEHADFKCRKCWKPGHLEYDPVSHSDVYEDVEYHCLLCNGRWISEGADA
jgi:hypothetical protein